MSDEVYDGGELLPHDAYIRHLLVGHESTQRLRMEALVYIADSMKQALDCCLMIAVRCGEAKGHLLRSDQTALFSAAWRIVDNLDAARQLLAGLGARKGPLTTSFFEAVKPAHALRNEMDHLNQRIPNYAASKGRKAPVFGSISFVFLPNSTVLHSGDEVTDFRAHAVGAGSLVGGEVVSFVNPSGRTISAPVGMLTLSAFSQALELEPPILAFKRVICALSDSFAAQVRTQIAGRQTSTGEMADATPQSAPNALSVQIPVRVVDPMRIGFVHRDL